ncbi:MAG: right-handed parallel beta-helix repeat-containing protein [Thermoplasmatales archaeon]|nr:MAG: right-handed parallel beta-helix repeat-containing protein [Thermoplasmatales archaeon]
MKNSVLKKTMVFAIIVMFIGTSTVPSIGEILAEKHISIDNEISYRPINNRGDTLYVGGSGPNNYSKIQDAIDNASDGDKVFVYNESSPYYEYLEVDKSIYLTGEDKKTTIIDGGGNYSVITITIDGVIINGFTIQNSGDNGLPEFDSGVKLCSDNNIISDVIISYCHFGICLNTSSSNNTILENNIYSNYDGIGVYYYANKNIISGNTIHSNIRDGIWIVTYDNSDNVVMNNNITKNNFGIYMTNSLNNTIINNNIAQNDDYGIYLRYSINNTIEGNNINSHYYDGIRLGNCSNNNSISYNIISKNMWGIYLEFSSNNTITGNKLTSNDNGAMRITDLSNNNHITNNKFSSKYTGHGHIELLHSSFNTIKHNNFIRMLGLQATFGYHWPEDNMCNYWNENYWNRPRIFPKPIIGFILFDVETGFVLIPWLQFDWRPALRPYDI